VTSDTLTADKLAQTMLFEHNVVATAQNMTLYADKMLVSYASETGNVSVIEATGAVKLHKESRLITAQKAIYYADEDKVIFSGNPRALDGENVVTGTKMIFFISDDRTYVENSKVYLKQ
jgi:lipopolysaccharide export system protein LptA